MGCYSHFKRKSILNSLTNIPINFNYKGNSFIMEEQADNNFDFLSFEEFVEYFVVKKEYNEDQIFAEWQAHTTKFIEEFYEKVAVLQKQNRAIGKKIDSIKKHQNKLSTECLIEIPGILPESNSCCIPGIEESPSSCLEQVLDENTSHLSKKIYKDQELKIGFEVSPSGKRRTRLVDAVEIPSNFTEHCSIVLTGEVFIDPNAPNETKITEKCSIVTEEIFIDSNAPLETQLTEKCPIVTEEICIDSNAPIETEIINTKPIEISLVQPDLPVWVESLKEIPQDVHPSAILEDPIPTVVEQRTIKKISKRLKKSKIWKTNSSRLDFYYCFMNEENFQFIRCLDIIKNIEDDILQINQSKNITIPRTINAQDNENSTMVKTLNIPAIKEESNVENPTFSINQSRYVDVHVINDVPANVTKNISENPDSFNESKKNPLQGSIIKDNQQFNLLTPNISVIRNNETNTKDPEFVNEINTKYPELQSICLLDNSDNNFQFQKSTVSLSSMALNALEKLLPFAKINKSIVFSDCIKVLGLSKIEFAKFWGSLMELKMMGFIELNKSENNSINEIIFLPQ